MNLLPTDRKAIEFIQRAKIHQADLHKAIVLGAIPMKPLKIVKDKSHSH